MPIYEYECKNGCYYEKIYSKDDAPKSILCRTCDFKCLSNEDGSDIYAERIWSKPANIQLGKPTIIFTNPQTGLSQIATSEHEQPPAGFTKKELKGPIERSKFEQQENSKASFEDAVYNENVRQGREEARKHLFKDIDNSMRDDAARSDNPAETVRLMEAAKKHIQDKKPSNKKRRTEFRFDVNHKDKSNLT